MSGTEPERLQIRDLVVKLQIIYLDASVLQRAAGKFWALSKQLRDSQHVHLLMLNSKPSLSKKLSG